MLERADSGPSLQEILRRRQEAGFVGRQAQLTLFRENLLIPVEDERRQFVFSIHGDGGIGKTFLLGQLRQLARDMGRLCALVDDRGYDVIGAMGVAVQQLEHRGARFRRFRRLYDAVESVPGTDPDRAAFTVALETARGQLIAADGIAPVPGRHGCSRIGRAVLENLLPPRRPHTAPRKVKCPISRYASPPDQLHLPATARITAVSVAIYRVQAPDGRRDRTLQLMRTDPHRLWHAREIAAGLGLPHHRGLTGELSRWVKEGIICKAAPGTFTLHADWIGPDNPAGHGIFDTEAPALTSRPWETRGRLRDRTRRICRIRQYLCRVFGGVLMSGLRAGHAAQVFRRLFDEGVTAATARIVCWIRTAFCAI